MCRTAFAGQGLEPSRLLGRSRVAIPAPAARDPGGAGKSTLPNHLEPRRRRFKGCSRSHSCATAGRQRSQEAGRMLAAAAVITRRSRPVLLPFPAHRVGHHAELDHAPLLLLLQVRAALLHVDVVPRQHLGRSAAGGASRRRRRCRGRANVCHQSSGWKHSLQPSSRAPRRQASSSAGGDAAVAARQDAFEQARLDVVLLDLHRA